MFEIIKVVDTLKKVYQCPESNDGSYLAPLNIMMRYLNELDVVEGMFNDCQGKDWKERLDKKLEDLIKQGKFQIAGRRRREEDCPPWLAYESRSTGKA